MEKKDKRYMHTGCTPICVHHICMNAKLHACTHNICCAYMILLQYIAVKVGKHTVCIHSCMCLNDREIFSSSKLFQAFRAVPKIGSIFITKYQFLETLTGRGVPRVIYEVPRLSKLHEDA